MALIGQSPTKCKQCGYDPHESHQCPTCKATLRYDPQGICFGGVAFKGHEEWCSNPEKRCAHDIGPQNIGEKMTVAKALGKAFSFSMGHDSEGKCNSSGVVQRSDGKHYCAKHDPYPEKEGTWPEDHFEY